MKEKIFVFGNGGWGTALAILLSKKGYHVTLWGHSAEYVNILKNKRGKHKIS